MNIEGLIEEHAKSMAEGMLNAVEWAQSEEDIRHACNSLIDKFVKEAGLAVRGWHEYGLAGGRLDSKYGGVVIEYKSPKGSGRLAEDPDSPAVKAVVEQIKRRFEDLNTEEHVALERIFGVGCDGNTIVFVQHRGKQIEAEAPQPVTPYTVQRLLRALVSVGARGVSFTPENLAVYFGSENETAQDGIQSFYDVLHKTDNPKALTFFRQWQILYGEVCGYDLHGQNARIRKLADHYGVNEPDTAELLFAVHTYYAIFIKLLAADILTSYPMLAPRAMKRVLASPTSEALRHQLRDIEQGRIWSELGIHNFLESDLFSWYLDAWEDRCEKAIRGMVRNLDQFDPTTLSAEPAESRDLLKQLYQQLFPRSVRHDLGEYYTPDWLADLVLDELGYDGNPDKRLLDPACGSGTFLVAAINRVKRWFDEHRFDCGFREDTLLQKILSNIIGFDLNPLAVMAARTNYFIGIFNLLRHSHDTEIPIYLCDSIMTPSEYGDLFTGGHNKTRILKTCAEDFVIPNEIAENREQVGRYADTIELCIRDGYSAEEFLKYCQREGIPTAETEIHKQLYGQLQTLNKENKNGIWARIIKNAFAPLFVGKVDYVAGNPPWVNWESLPDGYRQSTAPLWQEYDLFRHKGYRAKLGAGKDDLSILMTYVAHDVYLADGGRLGFVITQSLFKTVGGGEGFRTLQYKKNGKHFYLAPVVVHDLSDFQPFEGATNRTAVIVVKKTRRAFKYPVRYITWWKSKPGRISPDMPLEEVLKNTVRKELGAQPINADELTSPWLTAPKRALPGIRKVIGRSDYKAYAGCCTWLNGCFWVRILYVKPNGELLIENLNRVGKIKVKQHQVAVEPDLVYPLLRGRDVRRWHAEPSAHVILTNRTDRLAGIPESTMKIKYQKTYSYLRRFEGDPKKPEHGTLRGRSGYRKYFKPTDP
ncbi:MAG TPA: N-6 DNA methylase, partial [bacterium]|nr:N-6 DNA methylase [bacterium]